MLVPRRMHQGGFGLPNPKKEPTFLGYLIFDFLVYARKQAGQRVQVSLWNILIGYFGVLSIYHKDTGPFGEDLGSPGIGVRVR